MAKIHGRNTSIQVGDSSGASQNLSGDMNNVAMTWTHPNVSVLTFGNDTEQRIAGIRDVVIKGQAVWNTGGAATAGCLLGGLMSSSTISLIKWYPAGSANTGCMFWTGCFLIDSYEEVSVVGGPVLLNFSFQFAAGSLSASTT